MYPFFLYEEDSKPSVPPEHFFCITSNVTDIFDGINQSSNYFIFNIIQYDEETDSIQVLHSTNQNLYNDISLNKNKNSHLFSDDKYGKYRIKDNSNENVADLFHSLYYEIEKCNHEDKNIENMINEYEKNIMNIKKILTAKINKTTINGYTILVNQSHITYNYDNKGNVNYNRSEIQVNEFIYFLKPIVTDMAKINNNTNIIEKNEKYKKLIFYTITIMKITKPKNTSFIFMTYIFICTKILFYSLAVEFFICLALYIFIFFIMRCILNPFSTFKTSIEILLENNHKNKSEEEEISKKPNYFEKETKLSTTKTTNIRDLITFKDNDDKKNQNKSDMNIKMKTKDKAKKEYMNNFIKITSEIESQYTNLEMKDIENIIKFLQKILLLRDENTPYQAKADFYQSISSEISKKYQLDLFKCQILIGEYYIKDKQYLKAKNELENLQIRIEQSKNEFLNKDKFNERKNGFLSTYYGTYINDFTENKNIKEDKSIRIEMILESYHFLMGLTHYFLFLELKHGKKKYMNQLIRQKTVNPNKISNSKDNKNTNTNTTLNFNVTNTFELNSGSNNLTSQMDYYLEKAIKHLKESYKINNTLQINQIKNIIILVYLSKCYLEFSNKSIEDANKALKKAFLTLSNFNELIVELTDDDTISIKKKKANNNLELLNKNLGNYSSRSAKDCYVDSRVMLIVNGALIQFILYQIGKMALKLHKNKVAYFCFVKLIQISYFKNENLHFKAIKWIRYLLNTFMEKRKNSNNIAGGFKSMIVKLKLKRTSSNISINLGNEEEIYINKSTIEYMKKYLRNLVELFEKNKYKRREKKTIIELLSLLDKKIVYKHKIICDNIVKKKPPNFQSYAKNYMSKLNQTQSSLTSSNKDQNNSDGCDTLKIQDFNDDSPSPQYFMNDKNSPLNNRNSPSNYRNSPSNNRNSPLANRNSTSNNGNSPLNNGNSPLNNNEKNNNINKIEKVISKIEYESITKSFLSRDLFIAQIINSPLKLTEEEKTIKCIEKQYCRLNPKQTTKKCLIIILSESFLQNFSSLKSFNLFIQDCIVKFLEDNDKIGYILYSLSVGYIDKIFELEYKSLALKNLDELFKNAFSIYKSRKSINKKKYLTDSFDLAMEMFNNEQLNNNIDINTKTDKYIFCFGTLHNLRYKCYEASFAQKNRINYMEISLYYFVFDSIDFYRDKITHYKKFFKNFIEGFLIFVENFKLIKLCFANICIKGKQKNLFSNKLECIQNII